MENELSQLSNKQLLEIHSRIYNFITYLDDQYKNVNGDSEKNEKD